MEATKTTTTTKRIRDWKYYHNDTFTEYTVEEGVEEIGRSAFEMCRNLRKVTIPRGVRRIQRCAFDLAGLTEVTLKEGAEEIGAHAFSRCALERVVLAKGMRKIGWAAFSQNRKLTELEIREGIESIGGKFVADTLVRTITLPVHSIPRIDKQAFSANKCYDDYPPLSTLTTLRLRRTYHAGPLSISFPRITEKDNGQLVRFTQAQVAKYLRAEILVADTIFYTCFSLKCRRTGLYNAYGTSVLARIFRFWFRGAELRFPIRGARLVRRSGTVSEMPTA